MVEEQTVRIQNVYEIKVPDSRVLGKVTMIKLIWLHVIKATCQAGKLILKNPRGETGGGRGGGVRQQKF